MGVDLARFATPPDETDAELRTQLLLPEGVPVFLSVGGVEGRKNTIRILEAFIIARRSWPEARLVVAGGASLLDHGSYQAAFARALAASALPAGAVIVTGPLPATADARALPRGGAAALPLGEGRLRPRGAGRPWRAACQC